jgi:hypothetical protein
MKYIGYFIIGLMTVNVSSSYLEFSYPKGGYGGLSENFLNLLRKTFNVSVLVESGTWLGHTVQEATKQMDEIYSIELSKELYNKAQELFKNNNNVHLFWGSSDKIFKTLLPTLDRNKRILFWLDAHDSYGYQTVGGFKDTPIAEELYAIRDAGITNAILLIDDVRDFFRQLPDYPTVENLKKLILEVNPDYQFYIFGDLGLAFLPSDNIKVSPLIKLLTSLYLKIPVSAEESEAFNFLQNRFLIFKDFEKYLQIF